MEWPAGLQGSTRTAARTHNKMFLFIQQFNFIDGFVESCEADTCQIMS